MALNKLMHPRNPYKQKKPDFKELSIKYEEFRKQAKTDLAGNVHLDFKNPACLRVLSWALLKNDFGLEVTLPEDRLIPTIPLRLNYILWLEDLIGKTENVNGIDIGAGASCVYPLIGASKNGWSFLATEADAYNFNCASKNVQDNNLAEKITVRKVEPTTTLRDILEESTETYDFMMCNPPFFASQLEAWGMVHTRSDERTEASSVSTACTTESVCQGGEVAFVKQLITDSVHLKDRVRIYSTMLGKKTSLTILKDELRRNQISHFGTTEFCQGKTMRWGLAWTFDPSVTFPKPPSKSMKAPKPKPPLCTIIPPSQSTANLELLTDRIKDMLEGMKIEVKAKNQSNNLKKLTILAKENTWSNQRRKRRQKEREEEPPSKKKDELKDSGKISGSVPPDSVETGLNQELPAKHCTVELLPETERSSDVVSSANTGAASCDDQQSSTKTETPETSTDTGKAESANSGSAKTEQLCTSAKCDDHLVKCRLELQKQGNSVTLKIFWISGQNREAMHQIFQFIKNQFTEPQIQATADKH